MKRIYHRSAGEIVALTEFLFTCNIKNRIKAAGGEYFHNAALDIYELNADVFSRSGLDELDQYADGC